MSNLIQFKNEQAKTTARVVNWVFNRIEKIGYNESDILTFDKEQIEKLLLDLEPNSKKAIATDCYILGLYNRWMYDNKLCDNENLYLILRDIDKDMLWRKAKVNAPKKFISNEVYKETILNIETFEPFNSLYYSTLFSCIYEGIYNDDLSVLWNLRGSDIHGNIVTLKENNGNEYELEISHRLAENLKELAEIDIWERNARFGTIQIKIEGQHMDSCFKVEKRGNSSNKPDAYKFAYYSKLNKMVKEYVEQNLLPFQLFVSGIMYRIRLELEKTDTSLQYVFAEVNKNRKSTQIIERELKRCHYDIDIYNFYNIVSGHIDVFSK